MCIICNCGNTGDEFLSEFIAARSALERASALMLECSKTATRPTNNDPFFEARAKYDSIHKKMVKILRDWNRIEHEREWSGV